MILKSWSYSKVKNFETCPKRYLEVDVLKKFKEDTTQLREGNVTHDMLAKAVLSGDVPPDPQYAGLQKWVDEVRNAPGELLTEQKYAIDRQFQPCEYFAPSAWYRGIGDVVRVDGPVADVTDWKTGKPKDDPGQLTLMAILVFAFHPEVQRIRTRFVWLQFDDTTDMWFSRRQIPEMWATILPRVERLKTAHEQNLFNPKPGFLCRRYCPVTTCPHHGK